MKQVPPHILARYLENPLAEDEAVRRACGVLAHQYYTVSVWPVAGQLRITPNIVRKPPINKISKSNQS